MIAGSNDIPVQSVAIILAAGSSSRMGQSKQLLNIDGESLLRRTVRTISDSGINKIVVVLGANEEAHQREISNLPVLTVTNPNWSKGMGTSLKMGVQFANDKFSTWDTLLITVCDQPLLTPAHLKKMIENHITQKSPIVASFYSGAPGVPVLFHRSLVKELLELNDEYGAKRIVQDHPELTSFIEFPEGAIDLDTPDDWKKFNQI